MMVDLDTAKSLKQIFKNTSDSFIGIIDEMYGNYSHNEVDDDDDKDATMRILVKENRYMYLALLILFLIMISNIV